MMNDFQYDVWTQAVNLTIDKLKDELDKLNCGKNPGIMFDLRGQIQALQMALEYAEAIRHPRRIMRKIFVEAEKKVRSENDYTPNGSRIISNTDEGESQ